MDTDFDIYIKLVGIQKVKNDLKKSLSEATTKEQWNLIDEIANFIQSQTNIIESSYNINPVIESSYNINPIIESSYKQDLDEIDKSSEDYIWKRLKYIISEQGEIEEHIIKYESVICEHIWYFFSSSSNDNKYYSDLGLDDLDRVELIMAVEEEFEIEIPDEIAEPIRTVKDLYDVVISALKEE